MSRVLLIFCILSFFHLSAWAQQNSKLLRQGDKHLEKGEVNKAIAQYLAADSLTPGNLLINMKLGRAYLESDFKHYALRHLETVYALDPEVDPEIEYYMGLVYQFNYRFSEASNHYQRYLRRNPKSASLIRQRLSECFIGDSLIMNPQAVNIQNLGEGVNSPEHDYTPLISTDESVLVFTSRRKESTGGKKTDNNEYYEDIYITQRRNGQWSAPNNISKNINFEYHDAASALSPDGKQLFLYMEVNGGDLYTSYLVGSEWSKPSALPNTINSPHWETSASITQDGKKLYFTSDRPGGFGGLDIYLSNKLPDGSWSAPRNLGPDINTPYNEDSPFIHPDGKTLYFSSEGHPGLGKHDIFQCEWQDGRWTSPRNMGYPINTPDDDIQFVISGNRKNAYYASIREFGVGKADIYTINFLGDKLSDLKAQQELARQKEKERQDRLAELRARQKAKLGTIALVKGTVYSSTTNKPIGAQLIITNTVTNELVAEVMANSKTGEFEIPIQKPGSYAINADSKGYNFYSRNLRVAAQEGPVRTITQDVWMHELSVGAKVILANIFFDSGKSSLRTESLAELEKIRDYLTASPTISLQINGHTDDIGEDAYNKVLSRERAEAVKKFLVRNGISDSRISVMGYGEEQPLVSNDDEFDGRAINRRTEIEIVSF